MAFKLPFALFLEARNLPVGITREYCPTIQSQLANQSARYIGYKHNPYNKYILFDGLTYSTRGYFASCVVLFRAPQGRGKMRAMNKMSASIIC